jgi:hypothetical protein
MDHAVNTLAVYNGDLVAGGIFDQVGDEDIYFIARWDGESWHPLGSGMDSGVWGLTLFGSDLIVGGTFIHAGGEWVNNIARWDGESWHGFGFGMNGFVWAVTVYDGGLIAAGGFNQAGEGMARHIARWDEPVSALPETRIAAQPVRLDLTWPNPFHTSTEFSYSVGVSGPVRLGVYDVAGHHVATLVDGVRAVGRHTIAWDGRDGRGYDLPAGVYVTRVECAGGTASGRVVLAR